MNLLDKQALKLFFADQSTVPFLSSLAQTSKYIQKDDLETPLATDGVDIYYNEELCKKLPEEYLFYGYIHCLWHIARLHNLRGKDKDQDLWEYCCDVVIVNDLIDHASQYGKYFKIPPENSKITMYEGWSEERIYEKLEQKGLEPGKIGHLIPGSGDTTQQLLKVQQAVQQARLNNSGLEELADITKVLESWSKPKVNWRKQLRQYFIDKADPEDITWRRPNRRYEDIYMPSKDSTSGKLAHLMYFIDVSGSISEEDIESFLNECHAVFTELEPEKMTIVSFDYVIQQIFVFDESHPFKKVKINIGGGTSYQGIHDILASEKPTAAVVFTDLWCEPMLPVGKVPVFWVVEEGYNRDHKLKTGKLIVIPSKDR